MFSNEKGTRVQKGYAKGYFYSGTKRVRRADSLYLRGLVPFFGAFIFDGNRIWPRSPGGRVDARRTDCVSSLMKDNTGKAARFLQFLLIN